MMTSRQGKARQANRDAVKSQPFAVLDVPRPVIYLPAGIFLALMMALVLAGCASWYPTEAGYRQILATWVGSTGDELIAKWGLPTSEHDSGGGKVYQYNRERT